MDGAARRMPVFLGPVGLFSGRRRHAPCRPGRRIAGTMPWRSASCLPAGPSAALAAERDLGPKTAIRARAEHTPFGGNDSGCVFAFGFGAGRPYGFRPNGAGPHVFGGIDRHATNGGGGARLAESVCLSPYGEYEESVSMDGSGSSMGTSLGAGWRFAKGNYILDFGARFQITKY